jgi:hypothetical protein
MSLTIKCYSRLFFLRVSYFFGFLVLEEFKSSSSEDMKLVSKSPQGPVDSLKPYFNRSPKSDRVSTQNEAYSIAIFLKIISF